MSGSATKPRSRRQAKPESPEKAEAPAVEEPSQDGAPEDGGAETVKFASESGRFVVVEEPEKTFRVFDRGLSKFVDGPWGGEAGQALAEARARKRDVRDANAKVWPAEDARQAAEPAEGAATE